MAAYNIFFFVRFYITIIFSADVPFFFAEFAAFCLEIS